MPRSAATIQEVEEDVRIRTAERFILSLGAMSPLFTTPVRVAQNAASITRSDDEKEIRDFALEALSFPFRVSPTCRAALFAFLDEIRHTELRGVSQLSPSGMMELAHVDEITAVLALTYLYRLLKKKCDPEEWIRLMPKISAHLEGGHLLGGYIPSVGCGTGMLLGGLRILAQAIFLSVDLKGFKEFRRKCESKKKLFDCAGEEERWGCNHLQVASCLSSAIGLNFTTRLALGLEGHAVTLAPHLCNIVDSCAPSLGALRALISGVESLHEAGTLSLRSKCVEIDGLVHEIELQSRSIRQSDGGLLWIHKTRDDLPAEAAEELKVPLPDKKEEEVEASE